MQLEDQMKSDCSQCYQPPIQIDHHSDLNRNNMNPEDNSDPRCNIWTNAETGRANAYNSHSFAMEARIRLDDLKSRCNSSSPCCFTKRTLFSYDSETDLWDSEESALDLVDILDVEDNMHDEESWLYEIPNKFLEEKKSALRWCRHVLDNPSPETEAACHALLNLLDHRSRRPFYRQPNAFHQAAKVPVASCPDKTTDILTHNTSDRLDHTQSAHTRRAEDKEVTGNMKRKTCSTTTRTDGMFLTVREYERPDDGDSHDSITTSYKLKDITDVHIMAQIQEASLRQDYSSLPPTASSVRRAESPSTSSFSFNKAAESSDELITTNKTRASSSPDFQPGVKLPSSSPCQLPLKEGCQSPRLARLRQQVTQFKLLKLAQGQGASTDKRRSPLRTSLRSLQAVRNSRSLDVDDDGSHGNQVTTPLPGTSYTSVSSGGSAMPVPPPPASASVSQWMKKDSSLRAAAIKKLQRSQSLSPSRITRPAKGYLPVHGRVFASPERVTAAAWPRNLPSIHRNISPAF